MSQRTATEVEAARDRAFENLQKAKEEDNE